MTSDRQLIDLTRRKLLIGAGAIGLASAGAGLGTSALFSDRESFDGNAVVAGTLDLLVHYESVYNGAPAENLAPSPSGTADGAAALFYTLEDVKPGDSGSVEFCFELNTNPAYLWFCTEGTADAENGQNEPELEAEGADADGLGELDDEILVDAFYCDEDGDPVDGGEIASGMTLAEFLATYTAGAPLNADAVAVAPGAQTPYPPSAEPGVTTGPCLCIEWELPAAVGNEVQSDSVAFDIDFHAVQARNTDGTENPCCEPSTTSLSTGVADWQVLASPDGTTGAAQAISAHPAWYPNVNPNDPDVPAECDAEWVNPYGGDGQTDQPAGSYVYELTFVAPATTSAANPCTLSGTLATDNTGRLLLDGVQIAGLGNANPADFQDPTSYSAAVTTPGTHTLRAEVENNPSPSGEPANPTGLFVCARLDCPCSVRDV
ncbi:SipW-dependent-type signal peptide-containing protein [Haloglomus halophilum]|uniref:SipW-dependent-type signal peptide-containing protein n=1 Tax=Haloglomus halophilum TaxID=2962672 RepID=UPI0020CA1FB5|nr:SipW-dependent-type signal peptide-containing protein [Haloglomus halophilum]